MHGYRDVKVLLEASRFLPKEWGFTFMMNFNLFMSLLNNTLDREPGVGVGVGVEEINRI